MNGPRSSCSIRKYRQLTPIATAMVLACIGSGSAASAETPHPAVARVVVQEADGVAYGSGTLVDVREQYGLIATNWHVVRDAVGKIEVVFPNGFRSEARPLKLDEDWDLAALVIWRPPIEPTPLANRAPRPGEPLTICGYGQGDYRAATGRCTEYYAPKIGLPHELVELSVEARQGDSGGPIFNQQGELAGVLFGAGQGTTMGAFGGRVQAFLGTLAADIGARPHHGTEPRVPRQKPQLQLEEASPTLVAVAPSPIAQPRSSSSRPSADPVGPPQDLATLDVPSPAPVGSTLGSPPPSDGDTFAPWPANTSSTASAEAPPATVLESDAAPSIAPPASAPADWFDDVKSLFALIGVAAVLVVVVRTIT